jgi:hypothetical protein
MMLRMLFGITICIGVLAVLATVLKRFWDNKKK